jgi:hypothetical protein
MQTRKRKPEKVSAKVRLEPKFPAHCKHGLQWGTCWFCDRGGKQGKLEEGPALPEPSFRHLKEEVENTYHFTVEED